MQSWPVQPAHHIKLLHWPSYMPTDYRCIQHSHQQSGSMGNILHARQQMGRKHNTHRSQLPCLSHTPQAVAAHAALPITRGWKLQFISIPTVTSGGRPDNFAYKLHSPGLCSCLLNPLRNQADTISPKTFDVQELCSAFIWDTITASKDSRRPLGLLLLTRPDWSTNV